VESVASKKNKEKEKGFSLLEFKMHGRIDENSLEEGLTTLQV